MSYHQPNCQYWRARPDYYQHPVEIQPPYEMSQYTMGYNSQSFGAENDQETTNGHPRRRIQVACARCRRRKIKCSGPLPDGQGCQNCKASGVDPTQCQFTRVNSRPIGWDNPGMNANSPDEHPHNPAPEPTPSSSSGPHNFPEEISRANSADYSAWNAGSVLGRRDSSNIPFGYQSGIESYGPHNCCSTPCNSGSSQYASSQQQFPGPQSSFEGGSGHRSNWSSLALNSPTNPGASFSSDRHLPVPGTMPLQSQSLGAGAMGNPLPYRSTNGSYALSGNQYGSSNVGDLSYSSQGEGTSSAMPPPSSRRHQSNYPSGAATTTPGFTFSSENRDSVFNTVDTAWGHRGYTSHNSRRKD